MSAGRVFLGIIFCLVLAILIIFFVTLNYVPGTIPDLEIEAYELFFYVLIHPYYCTRLGLWWALVALIVGVFLGGLIAKSTAGGVAVGISTWIIAFLLYLGIIWVFDFNAMLNYWTTLGNTFYLDIGVGLSILVILGAISGKLTSDGSD